MVFTDLDKFFMESAMDLARQSFEDKEVPVGAVIVKDNENDQRVEPTFTSI